MIGTCLLGMLLFKTPEHGDWKLMFILISIPGLMSSVIAVWYLKESPRYAIFENFEEGVALLNHIHSENHENSLNITEENKVKLQTWLHDQNLARRLQNADATELFQGQNARVTILLWIMWFIVSFSNTGIILALPSTLSKAHIDVTEDLAEVGIAEVGQFAAMIVCYFVIDNVIFGRKKSLAASYLFAAATCLVAFFARGFVFCALLFCVKFGISCIYVFLFPLTSEMYHTKIRSTGLGFANAIGSVGGIAVPLITVEALESSPYLPYVIFGVTFFIGGIATVFLPYDTTGRELDVVENTKDIAKDYKAV